MHPGNNNIQAHKPRIPNLQLDEKITIFLDVFFGLSSPLFGVSLFVELGIVVGDFLIQNFCRLINEVVKIFSKNDFFLGNFDLDVFQAFNLFQCLL